MTDEQWIDHLSIFVRVTAILEEIEDIIHRITVVSPFTDEARKECAKKYKDLLFAVANLRVKLSEEYLSAGGLSNGS